MKLRSHQKSTLQIASTLFILFAIPISVIGTQRINDIRNRAAEEELQPIEITTDFSTETASTAYSEIPYEQKIELSGIYSETADLYFGCNKDYCGDLCREESFTPPQQLNINSENNSLYWTSPPEELSPSSWNITLSAVAPTPEGDYACDVKDFTLTLYNKNTKDNDSPVCGLLIPKQNDLHLPQNQQLGLTLWATDYDSGIKSAQIDFTQNDKVVESLTWNLEAVTTAIINKDSSPALVFNSDQIGEYQINAVVTDEKGISTKCEDLEERRLSVVFPGNNGAPEFQTDPYIDSQPGTTINANQLYNYEISAIDQDTDTPLDYFVIDDSEWLRFNETKNINGVFEGRFTGTPSVPGSYTVVFALTDGMHNHYSTQIWVVSVDDIENDTPIVNIASLSNQQINPGDSVDVNWTISDDSEISDVKLYYSSNPAETSTWKEISSQDPTVTNYRWNTQGLSSGEYFIVVQVKDNGTPSLTGLGISNKITIRTNNQEDNTEENEDQDNQTQIPTSHPTISNMQPSNATEIQELKPVISADLKAANGFKIEASRITLELDNQKVTQDSEIRGVGTSSGSIVYKPEISLLTGDHKVSLNFYDSSGKLAHKSWTFTIDQQKNEIEDQDSQDNLYFLGLKIPKRTMIIVGVGLLLIILAIIVPWLLLAAWKRTKDDSDDRWTSKIEPEPKSPPPSNMWKPSIPQSNISEKTPEVIDFSNENKQGKPIQPAQTINLPDVEKYEISNPTVKDTTEDNRKISTQKLNPTNHIQSENAETEIERLQQALNQISKESSDQQESDITPKVNPSIKEKDLDLSEIAQKPKLSIDDLFPGKEGNKKNNNKRPPSPPNPIRPIAR